MTTTCERQIVKENSLDESYNIYKRMNSIRDEEVDMREYVACVKQRRRERLLKKAMRKNKIAKVLNYICTYISAVAVMVLINFIIVTNITSEPVRELLAIINTMAIIILFVIIEEYVSKRIDNSISDEVPFDI